VARRDDLVDEGRPVVGPFLLEDRDEDEVELVQQGAVGAAAVVVVGELDDEVYDEVADACAVSSVSVGGKGADIP
jgi:hypothetical protein